MIYPPTLEDGRWSRRAKSFTLILEHLSAEAASGHQLGLLKNPVKIPAMEMSDHSLKARQQS
jgi:hypothetical protein